MPVSTRMTAYSAARAAAASAADSAAAATAASAVYVSVLDVSVRGSASTATSAPTCARYRGGVGRYREM